MGKIPDGPFMKPHPVLWRLVLWGTAVYETFLVFILLQTPKDGRQIMRHLDSSLGKPLQAKITDETCQIYDPENIHPWHNLTDNLESYVFSHFVGWWFKALHLRDWWMCLVISVMFELLEYTLEHQVPAFQECWWDHWITDALLSNCLGIYLGMKTLNFLSLKPFNWRGVWHPKSYRGGKANNDALQFTPVHLTDFDLRPKATLKRWLAVLAYIVLYLLAELNTFYLMAALWIPLDSYLCAGRLAMFLVMAAPATAEIYRFVDDRNFKTLGAQAWITISIIVTETLVVVKLDIERISRPIHAPIAYSWKLGLIGLVLYTAWAFSFKKSVQSDASTPKKVTSVHKTCEGESHARSAMNSCSNSTLNRSCVLHRATENTF